MTKAEYNYLYALARARFPGLTNSALQQLKRVYNQAADDVAAIIARAEMKGLSEITTNSWRAIQVQLEESADEIQAALRGQIERVVTNGARRYSVIDEAYLVDVAGETAGRITATGIHNMIVAVDRRVVASIINRVYQDGYTYSQRLWRAGAAYGTNVKNVVSAGLAQGRDIFTIARDVQQYVRRGREALVKRYGDLKPGTRAFVRRVGKRVEYNSLRLIRSELYASMQDAGRLAGQMNPGCIGMYEWIRGGAEDWGCECPDFAAGSPYTLEAVPSYPHPQCLCRVQPVLRDRREFVADLREWAAGGSVQYLDDWYRDWYVAA
jgi:hypothetical protein